MNETMTQEGYATMSEMHQQGLEAAAADFRRSVQDAAGRLGTAAEQFITMSEGLAAALDEARAAAERAQAAQQAAESAQQAAEAVQQRMQRDYGAVSDLVRELQVRISALATLAQPLSGEARAEPESTQEETPPTTPYYPPSETSSPSW
jgi:hypothetical protein